MAEREEPIEASEPSEEEEEITATEARELLHIGHTRFAQLLKERELPYRVSPLDHRVHLIKRRAVLALLRQCQGTTVEQARKLLGVSNNKILALINSGELPVKPNPLDSRQRLVDPDRFASLLAERSQRKKRGRDEINAESS